MTGLDGDRTGTLPASAVRASLRAARPSCSLLSVIVPAYNESDVIDRFLETLLVEIDGLCDAIEVICVDDGSTDDTFERIARWHAADPRIKVLSLTRNFGKEPALSAAIDHAEGDAVVAIDADLQHPPRAIREMFDRWQRGSDVVVAVRRERARGGIARRLFYRAFNWLSDQPLTADAGDFRLMDRAVILTLRTLPERNRFMKGLFAWVGYRVETVPYDLQPRAGGRSHWPTWRLWNFAIDGITAFSTLPLRIWSYIGLGIAMGSLAYALWIVATTVIYGVDVPGFASLIVLILFLGAVQLISLGVLGEYIGRMMMEVKGRPLYLVRDRLGDLGQDDDRG